MGYFTVGGHEPEIPGAAGFKLAVLFRITATTKRG